MSEIDWSKAPEGTTHCARRSIYPWHKHTAEGNFYWVDNAEEPYWSGQVATEESCAENYGDDWFERPSGIREILVESRYPSRDDFALAAMQGLLSNESAMQRFRTASEAESVCPRILVATAAYALADTMLAERVK